jgi:VWFA-related protein
MRISCIAALIIALAFASAATPEASRQVVYVTLVHTHFTATDRQGRLVTTLGPHDVTLYDNDVAMPVADFARAFDTPVDMAVLVDRSQSVNDRFPFLVSAATTFVRSVLSGRDDRGLTVAFDSKVYLLHDWTDDAVGLAGSLQSLTAAGGTSLFDAVYKTCRDKFEISDVRRNALVLVTDGEDSTSQATLEQAAQMATIARVVVYVIGVRAEHSMSTRELQGTRVVSRLAELTGGRVFYPDEQTSGGVAALVGQIGAEIRGSYMLSYYLDAAPDHSFHRIRVEAKDRTIDVHAPSGYYALRSSEGR